MTTEKRAAFSLAITCFNILVIALLLLSVHAQDYPPCETMTRQPGTNGAAWTHGATVTLIINPTNFPTLTERGEIDDAFRAWENANTNSGRVGHWSTCSPGDFSQQSRRTTKNGN